MGFDLMIAGIMMGVTCAPFCCYIATQKNRSSIAWLILGLFFGLIALISIVGVPRLYNSKPFFGPLFRKIGNWLSS